VEPERITIEGHGLVVIEQPGLFDEAPQPTVNPKRKRPEEYVAPPPSDVDLVKPHEALAIDNPYWPDEANDWADAHPEVRPKDAAKKWRKHRIEPKQRTAA